MIIILSFFLQDWERKHKQVVTVYRSHLLAAVQVSSVHSYAQQLGLKWKFVEDLFACLCLLWITQQQSLYNYIRCVHIVDPVVPQL